MRETNVTRRRFLQGAGMTAASIAAVSMLGGCSAKGNTEADTAAQNQVATYEPSETMDVDIVVVGSGSSGVAAAVQAAELGAKTLLLEKSTQTGGNGRLTEGMFAINSQMQKQLGVGDGVTFTDIIAAEQEFSTIASTTCCEGHGGCFRRQHRLDGVARREVLRRGGRLPRLRQVRLLPLFVDGRGSNYIDPMLESAQNLGATVMTEDSRARPRHRGRCCSRPLR